MRSVNHVLVISIALVSVGVVIVFGALFLSRQKASIYQPEKKLLTSTVLPTPTEKLLATATLKPEALAEKIRGVLPNSLSNPDVIVGYGIDFSNNAPVPGKKDVVITVNQNGAQHDTDSMREAAWKEAIVIMQRVFPLDDTIDGIILDNKVGPRDAYGNTATSIAITLLRKTYNRIDFKTFDYKDIPAVADNYVEDLSPQ